MSAKYSISIPVFIDLLFAWPVLLYRRLKYGYSYRRINLGEGRFTLVDSADFYRLNKYRWYADGRGELIYAVRNIISAKGKSRIMRLHKEILNVPKGLLVDHKNCGTLDNRRDNLREATKSQNSSNKRIDKSNTLSRFRGVSYIKRTRRWTARIHKQGKSIWLGGFENEIDAAWAYDAAAKKYHGEFARLNFPQDGDAALAKESPVKKGRLWYNRRMDLKVEGEVDMKRRIILATASICLILGSWLFSSEPKEKSVQKCEHKHRAFSERVEERGEMVARQIKGRDINDANVLRAMRIVPRHYFVPSDKQSYAYIDLPLPIGQGQTISQPYIVGFMTDALKLTPESKVLEIGTGSGYQAAVCAEIAEEVYTIEIIKELAESAEAKLKELGYENVFVKCGDGYFGWAEAGPFDAIIGTAAAEKIPAPLLEQLKPAGRMILPYENEAGFQYLVLVTKDPNGAIHKEGVLPVRFVPMTGRIKKGS